MIGENDARQLDSTNNMASLPMIELFHILSSVQSQVRHPRFLYLSMGVVGSTPMDGAAKAPSPVVASTLAPAEISFSATAARPSLAAQCSAETPHGKSLD